MNAINSSLTPKGAGAADSGFFDIAAGGRCVDIGDDVVVGVLAVDFDWVIGAGVGEWLGSAGVPITFKTDSASGSPVYSPEPEEEDGVD